MLLCWNKEQGDVEIIADPTVDCGRNFDNRATPATANIGNKTATGSCRRANTMCKIPSTGDASRCSREKTTNYKGTHKSVQMP